MIGRVAALAAVVVAIVAVAVIVLSGGQSYEVFAVFQNAGQIVSGDQIEVAGNTVGTVKSVALTANGEAQIGMSIKSNYYQPLHQGTEATIRLTSLSGIANRYVDLRIGSSTAPKIPNNGIITTTNTTTAVDLDELFNTLDAPTRHGLQQVIQGTASEVAGQGKKMQAALAYLNPAIASSSVLFSQINRDTGGFTNFLTRSSKLVTDLSTRAGALSSLVTNLNTTTQALAAKQAALGESIRRLPGFMALANTTFVNLRNALNDLTPLVNATKPVAPKLRVFLEQLRPLAQQAVPTVRSLASTIRKNGADNDLIELTKLQPGLAAVAVKNVQANGKSRLGTFPQTTISLNDFTPELAVARPYAPDLTGWFEGFSHIGVDDANGATSRIATIILGGNALSNSAVETLTSLVPNLPLSQQAQAVLAQVTGLNITTGQGDRCPGSMERGGVYYPESGFPCTPSEVPTGP
jgi:phospholipid/cholesterol/gamma-HCH transport system substrate-binding protein